MYLKNLCSHSNETVELVNLDVRDIDFERRLTHIRESKGGKTRTIPASEDILGDLKHLLGNRKNGPVFTNSRGERLAVRQINNIVARAGERAGIQNPNPEYKNLTSHLFRHSFARQWKKQGGPTQILSKILWHTSIKTTFNEYRSEDRGEVQTN